MAKRESVVNDCLLMKKVLLDCTALDAEIDNLNEEITVVAEPVKNKNANTDTYRINISVLIWCG